jgi:hypothetical protein
MLLLMLIPACSLTRKEGYLRVEGDVLERGARVYVDGHLAGAADSAYWVTSVSAAEAHLFLSEPEYQGLPNDPDYAIAVLDAVVKQGKGHEIRVVAADGREVHQSVNLGDSTAVWFSVVKQRIIVLSGTGHVLAARYSGPMSHDND